MSKLSKPDRRTAPRTGFAHSDSGPSKSRTPTPQRVQQLGTGLPSASTLATKVNPGFASNTQVPKAGGRGGGRFASGSTRSRLERIAEEPSGPVSIKDDSGQPAAFDENLNQLVTRVLAGEALSDGDARVLSDFLKELIEEMRIAGAQREDTPAAANNTLSDKEKPRRIRPDQLEIMRQESEELSNRFFNPNPGEPEVTADELAQQIDRYYQAKRLWLEDHGINLAEYPVLELMPVAERAGRLQTEKLGRAAKALLHLFENSIDGHSPPTAREVNAAWAAYVAAYKKQPGEPLPNEIARFNPELQTTLEELRKAHQHLIQVVRNNGSKEAISIAADVYTDARKAWEAQQARQRTENPSEDDVPI